MFQTILMHFLLPWRSYARYDGAVNHVIARPAYLNILHRGAIEPIQQHMDHQTNPHDAQFWYRAETDIYRDGRYPVHWVESDTAPAGVIDRIGQ